jgi:hypothetical protein
MAATIDPNDYVFHHHGPVCRSLRLFIGPPDQATFFTVSLPRDPREAMRIVDRLEAQLHDISFQLMDEWEASVSEPLVRDEADVAGSETRPIETWEVAG